MAPPHGGGPPSPSGPSAPGPHRPGATVSGPAWLGRGRPAGERETFRAEVLAGLGQEDRRLPCKYLYDEQGCGLFALICGSPDYYLTRSEVAILAAHGPAIAEAVGSRAVVIEYGAGSADKTTRLIAALSAPMAYVPVDLSRRALMMSAAAIGQAFPTLPVVPTLADFTRPVALPRIGEGPRLGFFPGSTIGNLSPLEAVAFLRAALRDLGRRSTLLVGVDLKKEPWRLNAAYDDRDGYTAAFNLNLLARINRELGGDFDLDAFGHSARYREDCGRVEMRLVSRRPQTVVVGEASFPFEAGQPIHTEDCYKYTIPEFQALARAAGWRPLHAWTDEEKLFSLHVLSAPR